MSARKNKKLGILALLTSLTLCSGCSYDSLNNIISSLLPNFNFNQSSSEFNPSTISISTSRPSSNSSESSNSSKSEYSSSSSSASSSTRPSSSSSESSCSSSSEESSISSVIPSTSSNNFSSSEIVSSSIVSSSENSSSGEVFEKTYKLIYIYNDNSTSDKQIIAIGEVPELEIPTREGYIFAGWYSDYLFNNKVNEGDRLTTDLTLFAKWVVAENVETIYQVGFEISEGYSTETQYNNVNPKTLGTKEEWSICMGAVSATGAISGDSSAQMRHYKSQPDNYGYLESNCSFENATKIFFKASSTGGCNVKVSKSLDKTNWQGVETYELNGNVEVFEYAISTSGENVYVRFDLIAPTNVTTTTRVYIDDIEVKGYKNNIDVPGENENPGDTATSTKLNYESLSRTEADYGGLSLSEFNLIQNQASAYYASVLDTYKGETLWTTLNEVTEPTYLTTYGDLRYVEKGNPNADASPNNQNKLVDFYSGALVNVEWNSGENWNREHVWCQSHGWWGSAANNVANGGSDLHHLRPEIPNINSSRNNSLYGEVSDRENKSKYYTHEETNYLYGYLDSSIDSKKVEGSNTAEGVFEPTDRVKGDVARIIMYLLVRYKGLTTPVTNIIYTEAGTEEAAYALLLKWHANDPVSEFEVVRNQRTYNIQGNRNPFIDCPTYADLIFKNL